MAYQPALFAPPVVPLDPHVVLTQDPRWAAGLAELETAPHFGLDIETYGEGDAALDPWRGHIRLIQVGLPSGLALVCDLGGALDDRLRRNAEPQVLDFLAVLRRALRDRRQWVIGHRLVFDLSYLMVKFRMQARSVRCTQLVSQVLWAGVGVRPSAACPACRVTVFWKRPEPKGGKAWTHEQLAEMIKKDPSGRCTICGGLPLPTERLEHSLEAVAERCGFTVDKTEQRSDWTGRLGNAQYNYAAADALLPVAIWRHLHPKLKAEGVLVSALAECEALPLFVEMSYRGMPVDDGELERVLGLYRAAQEAAIAPWQATFPRANPGSPAQVLDALHAVNFQVDGTDDAALRPFAKFPEIQGLLDWRSLGTQVTYLEGIRERKHGGAVRGAYTQIAPAGHGRTAAREPNLQNCANLDEHPEWKALGLPSARAVFKAPPGKRLIVADLSQAHARIATECSKDPTLLAAYRDGLDMHSQTAAAIAQGRGQSWTPDQIAAWRKDKTHPHHGLAAQLRQDGKTAFYRALNLGGAVTQAEKDAQAAWRKTFAGLAAFQKRQITTANANRVRLPGQVVDYGVVRGPTGRRLYLEILPPKHSKHPGVKGTDCVAFTWMGAEADIIKVALSQIQLDFDEHPEWEAWFCNMAHDEVDVLCLEEHALAVATAVQRRLHQAMRAVVKCIPVDEEGADPKKMICLSWAEK